MAAVEWREQRSERNLRAYLEWERERAKLHHEFARMDSYELMDDEPEQVWVTPTTNKKKKRKR